jgi:phytoene dehydrogenase-like protein
MSLQLLLTSSSADICIIGGGVSGLIAAITVAEQQLLLNDTSTKIVLMEGSATVGGRVTSDVTDDGFVLDRGFAVFIEGYPVVQELSQKGILNIPALGLGRFVPGAKIKLPGVNTLARVADPLRDVTELMSALTSPIGTFQDKFNVLRLVIHTSQRSVKELFDELESSTQSALLARWEFQEDFIDKFFRPFLEGIFLAPLQEQSSRVFHFIWKMFSEGATSLPAGGMGAISKQLATKAKELGVDIRVETAAGQISSNRDGSFNVDSPDGTRRVRANFLILATDGRVAQKLMSGIDGFHSLATLPETAQREVACIYYGFSTPLPPSAYEPILFLSGRGELRGTKEHPINNVCFPSVVNHAYAPKGSNLCSVTILSSAIEHYRGHAKDLEAAVREELCSWFPDVADDITSKWELKGFYYIPNAQPAQFGDSPFPASVNGGRDCTTYRGKKLPEHLVVCGDHMATATLNGALESGINAGKVVAASFAATPLRKL